MAVRGCSAAGDALSINQKTGGLPRREAQEISGVLAGYCALLQAGAGGINWLSRIRNNLQYKQGMGAWYPIKLTKPERSLLERLIGMFYGDPLRLAVRFLQNDDLARFVVGCVFTVSMCHALLQRLSERSTARGGFADSGPLAMLRLPTFRGS